MTRLQSQTQPACLAALRLWVWICLVVTAMVSAGDATAQRQLLVSTWDHNGSTMLMEQRGRNVVIKYEDVSARMDRAGVRSGTILFEGRVNRRNRLVGDAYVFRRGCDPAPYDVRGRYNPDIGQQEIMLRGAAPIRRRGACRVVDYARNRSASRLRFTLIGSDGHAGRYEDDEGRDEPVYQDGHAGRADDFEGQEGLDDDRVTEGPSFNCQPYVTSGKCPEAMICASGQLASQDLMMAGLYKDVLRLSRSGSERARHREEQRSSLKDRNNCGCDFECLQSWYFNMNKSLGKTTVIMER